MTNQPEHVNILEKARQLPRKKQHYVNGFALNVSPADCTIVLLTHNEPVAYVSTSHTIARTLAAQLTDLLDDVEKRTQQPIKRLEELRNLMEEEDTS